MRTLSNTYLNEITQTLARSEKRVYTPKDLDRIRLATRGARTKGLDTFCRLLVEATDLQQLELKSASYGKMLRYCWGNPCPYEVALSIREPAYLSHASAAFLHGLLAEEPRTIYVNAEQGPKPKSRSLSQEAVDRAFALKQRQSNFAYQFNDHQLVIIRGKHTGQLGVVTLTSPTGRVVRGTNLERTLIDLVVRTAYAGGVPRVLQAYQRAKDFLSVDGLVAILERLGYMYPYHQAIGFYLERVGCDESKLSALRKLGCDLDFYLTHNIQKKKFHPGWRVFYPARI